MKKMISIIAVMVALTLNAQDAQDAQDAQAKPLVGAYNNQLGVRFSNLTGYGVSHQYSFLDDYAVRSTAWFKYYEYILGPKSSPLKKETNKDYNFGIEIQRNIFKEDKYRVFAYIGGGYAIKEEIKQDSLSYNNNNFDNVDRTTISGGVGVGLEYFFYKTISADIGFSYKFDSELNKNVNTYIPQTNSNRLVDETRNETGLGINIGLNFNF